MDFDSIDITNQCSIQGNLHPPHFLSILLTFFNIIPTLFSILPTFFNIRPTFFSTLPLSLTSSPLSLASSPLSSTSSLLDLKPSSTSPQCTACMVALNYSQVHHDFI